jgi:two-component system sensor histidine kinase BaeS
VSLLALCGWMLALVAGVRLLALRRRLELVACAEHELRGPLAALTLAAARSRPIPAPVVEGQLERALVALADLTEARRGLLAAALPERHDPRAEAERAAAGWAGTGAEISVDWRAGHALVDADPGRISQALGNLLSNAIEHGGGRAELRGVRSGDQIRIEVADGGGGEARKLPRRGRGRGLAIAARAVEEAGGHLRLVSDSDGTVASIELPLADA